LKILSLSGSGLAVKGPHILDPRTGAPTSLRNRAWALTDVAAESDALSTACMILSEPEINGVVAKNAGWLVFLSEGETWRSIGSRPPPLPA
jgi:thiamine biosynthesis lipoprotein